MQQDIQDKLPASSDSNFMKVPDDLDNSNFGKEDEGGNSNSEQNTKVKKKYSVITQEVREKFIKRVISREVTIKEAAKEFGIKFSTSKAILQTYKREGRIGKKKTRQRRPSHSEQENVGNSQHSPKTQPQFKGSNKVANGEEVLKATNATTQRQHVATNLISGNNHPYKNAMTHQIIGNLEMGDHAMMDTDFKNTIYEMQATIQDGYPVFDPNLQTPIIHPGLLKQSPEGMMHHPNFSIDPLAPSNKIPGSVLGNNQLLGNPGQGLINSQQQSLSQQGASQMSQLVQPYQYQFAPQHLGQSIYQPMYSPYGFPQPNNYQSYGPIYYHQPPVVYPMQQGHPQSMNGAQGGPQSQKMPRRLIYSNPFNSTSSTTTSENQGPTFNQIRDQIKSLNTDQLRINAQQYTNKDLDRDNEFNYQKYYQQ